MDFQEKLELIQASIKLAKFWGKEPKELLGFVALIDKDKQKEWNKIAKEVIEFNKMDIEDRARNLGFKILRKGR